MVAESFERVLKAFSKRKPFRPFVVELVSGDKLVIEHPEALVFRDSVAVFFCKQKEITIFDHEGVAQLTDKGVRKVR